MFMDSFKLPETAAECRDLQEWMELVLGMTQAEIAHTAGLHQSRVSAVFNGQLPRRKLWPPLLRALRLEKQEHEFYRMIMAAKRRREKAEGAAKALAAGKIQEPLFAETNGTAELECEERSAAG